MAAGVVGTSRGLLQELDRLEIYQLKVMMCDAVSAARRTPPAPPPSHLAVAEVIIGGNPVMASETMRNHLEQSQLVYGFIRWYCEQRLAAIAETDNDPDAVSA